VISILHKRKLLPLITLGIGLILLGTALIIVLVQRESEHRELLADPDSNCIQPAIVEYNAPTLTLKDLGLQDVTLETYQDDIVLLNTWATWCPPCRAEMPDLQTFYDKYHDMGFTLIGINIGESREQVLAFALEHDLTFPMWLDPTELTLRAFNTISLPYSAVIDREGIVRYAWSGATCLRELESTVTPLIMQ
jgi:peroxiredoxin